MAAETYHENRMKVCEVCVDESAGSDCLEFVSILTIVLIFRNVLHIRYGCQQLSRNDKLLRLCVRSTCIFNTNVLH